MKRTTIVGCIVLALLWATTSPAPAHDQLRYWRTAPTSQSRPPSQFGTYGGCTTSAQVTLQELGKSGVNRLRTQWQLRSPNDINGQLFTYLKTGWAYSGRFPDDGLSYHQRFGIVPGVVNFASNREFALWAKMVGERPSFWQRDLVIRGNLGTVACSSSGGA